jgi:hypothetical protein
MARRTLPARAERALTLRLSRAERTSVRRAHARGERVSVRIALTARDGSGNQRYYHRTFTVPG